MHSTYPEGRPFSVFDAVAITWLRRPAYGGQTDAAGCVPSGWWKYFNKAGFVGVPIAISKYHGGLSNNSLGTCVQTIHVNAEADA